MKPWDLDCDEDEMESWKQTQASDFYFAPERDYIWICPVDYFDAEGCCYDQDMPIQHLLPKGMYSSMEACWKYQGTKEEICDQLRQRGFQESQDFFNFINQ